MFHNNDARTARPDAAHVAVIGAPRGTTRQTVDAARALGWRVTQLNTAEHLKDLAPHEELDAVLVTAPAGRTDTTTRVIADVSLIDPLVSVVACPARASADDVITLVRAGAHDVISRTDDANSPLERLAQAVHRTRERRDADRHAAGLSRMCKELEQERRTLADIIATNHAAAELTAPPRSATDNEHPNEPATAPADAQSHALPPLPHVFSQLDGNLDHELDVEELLRGSLERLAHSMRSMNAAVFLPTSAGDYALGGYVNADLSGHTRDVLLETLAESIPPAVESTDGLLVLSNNDALHAALPDAADWLTSRAVVAASCVDRDDTIATLAFFRDASVGFTPDELDHLRRFRAVFTQRLARVVRVHNRTVPGLQWFGFDVGDTDREDNNHPGEEWRDAA